MNNSFYITTATDVKTGKTGYLGMLDEDGKLFFDTEMANDVKHEHYFAMLLIRKYFIANYQDIYKDVKTCAVDVDENGEYTVRTIWDMNDKKDWEVALADKVDVD